MVAVHIRGDGFWWPPKKRLGRIVHRAIATVDVDESDVAPA